MSIVSLKPHVDVRRAANGAPLDPKAAREEKLAQASEQFEALFLQQILKQMRKANDALGASSLTSRESGLMRDLYDEVLAESMATQRQTGLSDMLVKQLTQQDNAMSLEDAERHAREGTVARLSLAHSESLRSTWQRLSVPANEPLKPVSFNRLVDSVIAQESGGNAAAISPKGARGLMQLMPETARDMAQALGLPFDEARLVNDADYNKRLGTAYLEKMLSRYDGHQALALAAYNAGPGKVDEWLAKQGDPRTGSISTREWIAAIPYAETRDYARSILQRVQAPTVLGLNTTSLNKAPTAVALTATGGADQSAAQHQSRSAAFARPLRLEPTP